MDASSNPVKNVVLRSSWTNFYFAGPLSVCHSEIQIYFETRPTWQHCLSAGLVGVNVLGGGKVLELNLAAALGAHLAQPVHDGCVAQSLEIHLLLDI